MVLEFHHLLPLLIEATSSTPSGTGTGRTCRSARWSGSRAPLGLTRRVGEPGAVVRRQPAGRPPPERPRRVAADASVTCVLEEEAAAGFDRPGQMATLQAAADRTAAACARSIS